MGNRRIGKINGKTVLLDTPPYNDRSPRRNEIISTIDSIQKDKGSVWFKQKLYPIVIDKWGEYRAFVTRNGKSEIISSKDIFTNSYDMDLSYNPACNIIYKVVGRDIRIISTSGSWWSGSAGGLFLTHNKDFSMYDEALARYPEEMKYFSEIL